MDAEAVSQRLADAFMREMPVHARMASNYNQIMDPMNRGLDPELYAFDSMRRSPSVSREFIMFHATVTPPRGPRTVQDYRQVDMSPEQAVLQKQSLIASVEDGLQVYLHVDSPGAPPERTPVMRKPLSLPAMAGSVFALSDADGVSGCFVMRGREVRYKHTLLDAPNVVVCQPSRADRLMGACRVIVTSRHLREPSHLRLHPSSNNVEINATTIGMFNMLYVPRVNVTVKHGPEAFTLAAYVAGLRSCVEGLRAEEAFTPGDVDRLFEGADRLAALSGEAAARAEFRAAVEETRASMLEELRTEAHALSVAHLVHAHLQRAPAASDLFRRVDTARRFLPSVPVDHTDPRLGGFDQPGTKLGEVRAAPAPLADDDARSLRWAWTRR